MTHPDARPAPPTPPRPKRRPGSYVRAALLLALAGWTAWWGLRRPGLRAAEAALARGERLADAESAGREALEAARREFLEAARLSLDDLRLYRWSPAANLVAGRSLSRLIYPEQAEPYYQFRRHLGRLPLAAQRDRVQGFLRAAENDRAASIARQALADHPDDTTLLRYLATAEWTAGHLADALEAAQRLSRTKAGQVDGLDLIATIQREADRREEAVAAARGILEVDPQLKRYRPGAANFWLEFCNDLLLTHHADEARRHLLREVKPWSEAAYLDLLGSAHKDVREFDDAEAAWRESIRRDPTRHNPWLQLGNLNFNRKRYPQAIDDLEHAVALAPQHIEANTQLARAYDLAGRKEDARRQRERVEAIKKVAPPRPPSGMGPSS